MKQCFLNGRLKAHHLGVLQDVGEALVREPNGEALVVLEHPDGHPEMLSGLEDGLQEPAATVALGEGTT